MIEELGKYGDWEDILKQINEDILKYLKFLLPCHYFRGGHNEYSSFVWADRREHLFEDEAHLIPYQIIGHSPVKTITQIKSFDEELLYFIDTHSTYKDGSSFGDKSYLVWNEDKFEIVY